MTETISPEESMAPSLLVEPDVAEPSGGEEPDVEAPEDSAPGDGILAEVARDICVLLGGGRVLLLVLTRPEIAEAMTTFGNLRGDPYRRLVSTVQATYTLGFGSEDELHRLAMHLRRVHRPIRGEGWRASDPELMFFTLSCLMHTSVDVFESFVRPLAADEKAAYYEASIGRGAALGVTEMAPPDWPTFTKWFDHQMERARVTPAADSLRWQILYPPRPGALRGVGWLWRYLAVSGLPPNVREQYGIHMSLAEQHRLHSVAERSRRLHERFPVFLWDIGRESFAGDDVLYCPPTPDRAPLTSWHIAGRVARSLASRLTPAGPGAGPR